MITDQMIDELIELNNEFIKLREDKKIPNNNKSVRKLVIMGMCLDNLDALQELKDRRESDIRPATAFLHQDIRDLVDKIDEEINEVKAELYLKFSSIDKERISEELIDVQMAAETTLTKIFPDIKDRMEARKKVIVKNEVRGYYNR